MEIYVNILDLHPGIPVDTAETVALAVALQRRQFTVSDARAAPKSDVLHQGRHRRRPCIHLSYVHAAVTKLPDKIEDEVPTWVTAVITKDPGLVMLEHLLIGHESSSSSQGYMHLTSNCQLAQSCSLQSGAWRSVHDERCTEFSTGLQNS